MVSLLASSLTSLSPSLYLLPIVRTEAAASVSRKHRTASVLATSSRDNNDTISESSPKPTKFVTFLGKGGSGKTTAAVFAAQVKKKNHSFSLHSSILTRALIAIALINFDGSPEFPSALSSKSYNVRIEYCIDVISA